MAHSTAWRTAAAAAVLLAALAISPQAEANLGGAQTGATTVSSASWSVIPTQSASTPAPGSLSLTFSHLVLAPPPQYFSAVNVGTHALAATSYGVTGVGGALLGNPVLTLSACIGATWNTSSDTCAGAATVIGSFTATATGPTDTTAAPSAAGSRLSVRASVTNFGLTGSFTATISTNVSSQAPRDIPAASTTSH